MATGTHKGPQSCSWPRHHGQADPLRPAASRPASLDERAQPNHTSSVEALVLSHLARPNLTPASGRQPPRHPARWR